MRTLGLRELGETGADRMLRLVSRAGRVGVVLLVTCLAALPLGLPPEARHVLPLLPLAAIVHCTLRSPGLVPEWLAFLCGLALDTLTQGPLGFWAFVYLAGHGLALAVWPFGERGAAWRLALVVVSVTAGAGLAWGLSGLYFGEAQPVAPWLSGLAWALPLSLAVVALLGLVAALGRRRGGLQLEREGWR